MIKKYLIVIPVFLSLFAWGYLFFHYDYILHHYADIGIASSNWAKYKAVEDWYLYSLTAVSSHFICIPLLLKRLKG